MSLTGPWAFDEIFRPGTLRAAFQPIYRVTAEGRHLHAVEGLIRGPKETDLESPTVLFEYCRSRGEETLLDRICARQILEKAAEVVRSPLRVNVNVHASSLARDAGFVSFLADTVSELALPPSRVVLEIVEFVTTREARGPMFKKAVTSLRDAGFSIALDDVGVAQSNFQLFLDVRPDYFKLDSHFVRRADEDPYRRAILSALARLADDVDALAVAEGVERPSELAVVQSLGIPLVQGFLFSPVLTPAELESVLASEAGAARSPTGAGSRTAAGRANGGPEPRPPANP